MNTILETAYSNDNSTFTSTGQA